MSRGTSQPLGNHPCLFIQQSAESETLPAESGCVSDSGEQYKTNKMIVWVQVGCSQPQPAFSYCVFHVSWTQLGESGTLAGLVPPSARLVQITT